MKLQENTVLRCMLAVVTMLVAGIAAGMMEDIRTYAYVTNEGSGTVSVIDVASHQVAGSLKVGEKPRGIAASADGSRLYVGDQSGRLIERDIFMGLESGMVALGHSPEAVYFNPDGKLLAIALKENDSIAVVDPAYMKVVKTIGTRGKNPEYAVFSPNGRWIYASAGKGDSVDVIDVAKAEVVKTVRVGAGPRGIAFLPDGSRAYVAVENANQIVAIDVARQEIVARIDAADRANGITVHPDGKRIFVSAGGAGVVHVDTGTGDHVGHRFSPFVRRGRVRRGAGRRSGRGRAWASRVDGTAALLTAVAASPKPTAISRTLPGYSVMSPAAKTRGRLVRIAESTTMCRLSTSMPHCVQRPEVGGEAQRGDDRLAGSARCSSPSTAISTARARRRRCSAVTCALAMISTGSERTARRCAAWARNASRRWTRVTDGPPARGAAPSRTPSRRRRR